MKNKGSCSTKVTHSPICPPRRSSEKIIDIMIYYSHGSFIESISLADAGADF